MAYGDWYAVRTVFRCSKRKTDGRNIFEERIVCFQAKDADEALEKAEREALAYVRTETIAEANHHHMVCYMQDGDELIDGYELWSELYESRLSLSEFYAERYEKYDYHPE